MTVTHDLLTTEPHVPLSRLRDIARDFQTRATNLRKHETSDPAIRAGWDQYALGLDAAAASLLEECREMEADERPVHQRIREDESNCECAQTDTAWACDCPCHGPISLIGYPTEMSLGSHGADG